MGIVCSQIYFFEKSYLCKRIQPNCRKRLPRIEALSDGVFSIATTFLASFFEFGGDICDLTQLCFWDFFQENIDIIKK